MTKDVNQIEKEFDSYLTISIIGASKDALRKQMKLNNESTIIDNEDYCTVLQEVGTDNNSLFVIEDIDLKIDMKIALGCLHRNEQTAINLLYNKQFTQEEVARMLDIHSNTVLNRKKSALNKLRKYFEGRS